MKVGIFGCAGAGKTTVFNALTGLAASTGPGARAKANLGMIKVPDERVDCLAEIWKPKKRTLAEIGFVDVAGQQSDAQRGLDPQVVAHLREVDALVHVVRDFDNPSLTAKPDPLRDLNDVGGDLILTDLIQVENRIERLNKEGNKKPQEKALMDRLHQRLDAAKRLAGLELSMTELQMISGYRFLTLKPCMALINRRDEEAAAPIPSAVANACITAGLSLVAMAAHAEAEIAELAPEEQIEFLRDIGLESPARDRFVRAVYSQLDLISFLTMGPDECRAWTIEKGTVARAAAGKVHTDIERGFIRAEVIPFAAFKELGSEAKCREAGKMRLEGKDYPVADGDIINFRFNV